MRCLHNHGQIDAALSQPRQHAHAVKIGHDEIENEKGHSRLCAMVQTGQSSLTPIDGLGVVAEAANHGFEEPSLNGVVVCNQNGEIHIGPKRRHISDALRTMWRD